MSGFNTKTPMMDWSPWMRRDFSAENRGGALADAFKVVGETADGYGETNDKNLLAGLVNETDTSKIPTQDFYSQANALKAKNLIETNKNLAYQDEQQKRANELNARNDANYYLGVFNKEAAGDALKMDKPTFDAKYANAGGLDWAMMYDTQNKKEDRTFAIDDRNKKNELTNLQMQSTKSQMNRANEEANYIKEQRDTTKQNKVNLDNLLGKYSSFEDFKKSEDWSNPQYNYDVKKTFYDTFGKTDKASLTDQIKLEEITNNKKDLPRVQEEYKKTYGLDMPISEQSNFVYKGELPEKMKKNVGGKDLPGTVMDSLSGIMEYGNATKVIKDTYNSENVGWADNIKNGFKNTFSEGNMNANRLESAHANLKNIVIKLRSGSAVSAQEADRMIEELGNMSSSETKFKAGLENFVNSLESKVSSQKDIYKNAGYDTTAFTTSLDYIKNMKTDVNSLISQEIIDRNDKKIKSVRDNNPIPTNQNISLTSSQAEALGIDFH